MLSRDGSVLLRMETSQYVWNPEQILPQLLGKWCFYRKTFNRVYMEGIAIFKAGNKNKVYYREEGLVTIADKSYSFFREYIYIKRLKGFSIYFQETPRRLFHQVILGLNSEGDYQGQAEHKCKYDNYQSRYRFCRNGKFEILHKVSGPNKKYDIETSYKREHVKIALDLR